MFGLQFTADHKTWFFAALIFPGLVFAEGNDAWISGKDNFLNLDLDQMENMGLLPIGLLDDDSLTELADAYRNGETNKHNLINVYWLMGQNLDEGKFREHFRRNLTRVLFQYFEKSLQDRKQPANTNSLSRLEDEVKNDYAHRYRFKINEDRLLLNYVIPF